MTAPFRKADGSRVIHPFSDGNGRVARLALNHLMRRYGQPYLVLPPLNESPPLLGANLDPLVRFGRTHLHHV